MYPEPLFSLMVETTIPPSQFSATSRSIDTNRALTTNFSGAFDFFDAANIHNFDWKHLDHLLNGLHNLQSLRITLQSRSLITVDQSPDWGNPERLTEEMRFWKGQNIQRSSIEEELPHAEEMKTNPLPLMGVWTAKEMGINPAALWGSWQGFPSPSFGGLNPPREIEAKVGVDELVEKISQQRAKGLGLVQEQMPLMKPLLSLII